MRAERLLVILDAEHQRQPALHRAAWVARRTGARLHLLQIEYHPSLDTGLIDNRLLARARAALLQQRQEELEASLTALLGDDLAIEVDVRWHKRRHEEILARIAVLQPDIVFKSTQPSNAISRLLLSNTSWQLVRRCPAPLWLVHDCEWRGERLCAALDPLHTDDKPATLDHQLIQQAMALSQELALQAHYLHCHPPMPQALRFESGVAGQYEDYAQGCAHQHRQAFDDLLGQYPIEAPQRHLIEGVTEDVMPHFVREHNIDLLLMGAVARGHLDNLLIGHTAERVLEQVTCDLLVLKPDAAGSAREQ